MKTRFLFERINELNRPHEYLIEKTIVWYSAHPPTPELLCCLTVCMLHMDFLFKDECKVLDRFTLPLYILYALCKDSFKRLYVKHSCAS